MVLPGSRVLAGWGRQLEVVRPSRLWAGQLLFHRVEALFLLAETQSLDSFAALLLKSISLGPSASVEALDRQFHLGGQLARRALMGLQTEGLAQVDSSGFWTATSLGRSALSQGQFLRPRQGRRVFHFLDPQNPEIPPGFLALKSSVTSPWPPDGTWNFHPALLSACVAQSEEWKRRCHFPLDILEMVPPPHDRPTDSTTWDRIVVDYPERLFVVLVRTASEQEGDHLLGYGVRTDGWALQAAEPAFELDSGMESLFPEWNAVPTEDQWRQSWSAWCQSRNLPVAEAAACTFAFQDTRLRIGVPKQLMDRFRITRNEVLKGETALLAGAGRVQVLAAVELFELG